MTHKFFALAVADMVDVGSDGDYPGWEPPELTECFKISNNLKATHLTSGVDGFFSNLPKLSVVCYRNNYGNVITQCYFRKADYGLTYDDWQAQYPDLICQFVFPLLEPRTIQLTPQEFIALAGDNVLSSDCGDTTVTFSADLKKYIDKAISSAVGGAIQQIYYGTQT